MVKMVNFVCVFYHSLKKKMFFKREGQNQEKKFYLWKVLFTIAHKSQ